MCHYKLYRKLCRTYHTQMDPRQSISIKVDWNGQEFPLRVPFTATIGKVKDLIYSSTRIPIRVVEQELIYLGEGLSDENTLQQYGILNGSVLLVYQRFELTIMLPNFEYVRRNVCEDYTVAQVRSSLVSEVGVQDIEGTALQMVLGDDRIVTLDDRSYLWAAGIVQDTKLILLITGDKE